MFMVSPSDAAAIRAAHQGGGDRAGAAELRRLFPGVPDDARAGDLARTIAGWLPPSPAPKPPRLKAGRHGRARATPP